MISANNAKGKVHTWAHRQHITQLLNIQLILHLKDWAPLKSLCISIHKKKLMFSGFHYLLVEIFAGNNDFDCLDLGYFLENVRLQ